MNHGALGTINMTAVVLDMPRFLNRSNACVVSTIKVVMPSNHTPISERRV
jgi:hypothetical protein